MPLNLSNRDQNSGHLFYNRRLKAAITRFSVRMKHDDRKQQAAVALSIVFVLIGIGWMALLHVMKPAGLVGQSAIIGNRDTGAVYAKINGRLYPALEPHVCAAGRWQRSHTDLGQGIRDRQVSDRSDDRHPGRARQSHRHTEFDVGLVSVRYGVCPGQWGATGGDIDRRRAFDNRPGGSDGPFAGGPGHSQGRDLCDLGRAALADRPHRQIGHLQLGSRPGRDLPDRDFQRTLRRNAGNGIPCGPRDPGVRHTVEVAARLDGRQCAADPGCQRCCDRLLRAAAGWPAKDHQFCRRSDPHRACPGLCHPDSGVAGQADPFPSSTCSMSATTLRASWNFVDTAANPGDLPSRGRSSPPTRRRRSASSTGGGCRYRSAWILGWSAWSATTAIPIRWKPTRPWCCR